MGSNNDANIIAGAITYPATERNGENIAQPPRQPRNLQGLLRFAMEGANNDHDRSTEFNPMDKERRNFLEEALKSLTINFVEVLQESIKILKDTEEIGKIKADEDVPVKVLMAFQNAVEVIYDIDNAQDFYKLGGYAIFPVCLTCAHEEVRALACDLLAEVCQNNPFCQTKAVEAGLLMVLMHLAKSEKGTALAKTVYAISAITRDYEPGYKLFISRGGCETLASLLKHDHERVRVKVIFLIRYYCFQHPEAKENFLKCGLAENLISIIKENDYSILEPVLEILAFLITDHRVIDQCKDPKHDLKNALQAITNNEDLHILKDILGYIETILKAISDEDD